MNTSPEHGTGQEEKAEQKEAERVERADPEVKTSEPDCVKETRDTDDLGVPPAKKG